MNDTLMFNDVFSIDCALEQLLVMPKVLRYALRSISILCLKDFLYASSSLYVQLLVILRLVFKRMNKSKCFTTSTPLLKSIKASFGLLSLGSFTSIRKYFGSLFI